MNHDITKGAVNSNSVPLVIQNAIRDTIAALAERDYHLFLEHRGYTVQGFVWGVEDGERFVSDGLQLFLTDDARINLRKLEQVGRYHRPDFNQRRCHHHFRVPDFCSRCGWRPAGPARDS